MPSATMLAMPWHGGEIKMHNLMSLPPQDNPTQPLLTSGAANRFAASPLIVFGAQDSQERPWTTIWGGTPGSAQSMGNSVLALKSEVDAKYDPVVEALFGNGDGSGGVEAGKVVRKQVMVSGLAIDLERRLRWKMSGKFLAGAVQEGGEDVDDQVLPKKRKMEVQMAVQVEQSLGNCPKYLNSKRIHPASTTSAKLISSSPNLCPEALDLIGRSDVFFVSSSNGALNMGTNHRGGPSGFVRVYRPKSTAASPSPATPTDPVAVEETPYHLIWPEYSGNRLYQTLGNLLTTPLAGLVFPDFETGDVLYLTGTTKILIGADAAALLPRSNLAVDVTITASRFVKEGLPFRGTPGEYSPYNPKLRLLTSESGGAPSTGALEELKARETGHIATLISQTKLTPTISRFRFSLSDGGTQSWKGGAWVALDFSSELGLGYSHMRDDDPRSLNDDFVRTFTVSSAPPPVPLVGAGRGRDVEFEITIRKVGAATEWLFKQNPRANIEIGVKGFGGGDGGARIEQGPGEEDVPTEDMLMTPVIAGGVGLTPLLAQIHELDLSRLRIFWTVTGDDLGLVEDTLKRAPDGAGTCFSVFVTGPGASPEEREATIRRITTMVRSCETRRLSKEDLLREAGVARARKWFACVSPRLRQELEVWLGAVVGEGGGSEVARELVFDDFGF